MFIKQNKKKCPMHAYHEAQLVMMVGGVVVCSTFGWMDGLMDGRTDSWLAGWLAGWMDGWSSNWMQPTHVMQSGGTTQRIMTMGSVSKGSVSPTSDAQFLAHIPPAVNEAQLRMKVNGGGGVLNLWMDAWLDGWTDGWLAGLQMKHANETC